MRKWLKGGSTITRIFSGLCVWSAVFVVEEGQFLFAVSGSVEVVEIDVVFGENFRHGNVALSPGRGVFEVCDYYDRIIYNKSTVCHLSV